MAVATRSRTRLPVPGRGGQAPAVPARGALAAIVLLGVVIRFPTLGQQSFWFDEAVTHGIVAHGLGHVISSIPRTESTPPLYYVLVWLWSRVFGLSEAGLRSFSALCGTLLIPVMWSLGRRLVSERVGLVAALLTAINPFLVWYSQEARSYALLTLLCAATLLALVHVLESPTRRRLLAWSLLCALALCAHYFAAIVIVPEAVWLLVALRRQGRLDGTSLLLSLGPIALMAAALAPLAIHQNDGRANYIALYSGSLPYRLAQFMKQDIVGFAQPIKIVLSLIGCLLVALAGWLLLWRTSRRERSAVAMPLAVALAGVVLTVLTAVLVTDYVNTRNLLPTWPALAVVVGTGFGAARAGRLGLVGLAALSALSVGCITSVIVVPGYHRDDWRGAARALGPATAPRAIVSDVVANDSLAPYARGVSLYPPAGMPIREADVIWLDRHALDSPLPPVSTLPALPGFTISQRIKTDSYIVIRYRSPAPRFEPPPALMQLYPNRFSVMALAQRP
jgi:mannosyltransferase